MPGWTLGLQGANCAVTGASRGIGRAVTEALLGEGARVLAIARSTDELEPRDGLHALSLDVTAPDAGERVHAAAQDALGGPVEVLVNNAGTSFDRPLEDLTDADWQGQWELHVMASMRLMRALVPGMAERGEGRVVNVCSSSGKRPSQSNAAYSVTKAAQLSLSRSYADAYAGHGVRVNAVAPGPVDTELWTGEGGLADQAATAKGITRDEALDGARAKVPIGRFGTAEEIAAVVVFLCSKRAANASGAAWSVDGGTVQTIV